MYLFVVELVVLLGVVGLCLVGFSELLSCAWKIVQTRHNFGGKIHFHYPRTRIILITLIIRMALIALMRITRLTPRTPLTILTSLTT